MDLQHVLNFAIGAVLAALGWFARQLWDAVAALRDDIRTLERNLPVHYVRKDDFVDAMRRVEDMLIKIFDKLDGKVDK
jgi:hypothetical protein